MSPGRSAEVVGVREIGQAVGMSRSRGIAFSHAGERRNP
jgi:hypothetical protein